ncbi:MAG: formate dehydrogenase accessory sulfurtransferase FdhD [Myxococcales bacterium]|nr:formate dehydrogenase accessory sulfurtransferase FdhD [Myxococcales bacterium]
MPISKRTIHSFRDGLLVFRDDELAVEEPLEIRAYGKSLAVLMRTPGDDRELVRGLMHAEGVIRSEPFALSVKGENEVQLDMGAALLRERWSSRDVITSSACGVCGAAAIAVLEELASPIRSDFNWAPEMISAAPRKLRAAQAVFSRTGGLHAAGLFDAEGNLLVCREDVGRHNAVDKVVGWGLLSEKERFSEQVLVVSGRMSYEIVHKAVAAGIPLIVAVSAPSSLAVDLAERWRVTLVGFVRERTFNVYSHPGRIR